MARPLRRAGRPRCVGAAGVARCAARASRRRAHHSGPARAAGARRRRAARGPRTARPAGRARRAAHPLLLRLGAVEATAALSCSSSPRCAPQSRTPGTTSRRPRSPTRCSHSCRRRAPGPGSCPGSASCRCPTTTASSPPLASSCCPAHCSIASPTRRRSAARPPSCSSAGGPTCSSAVGVLAELSVLRDEDVLLDPGADGDAHDLDDESGWLRALRDLLPPDELAVVAPELLAVRDLDLVRDDAWDVVLAAVAVDRELRRAVVEPTLVVLGDGTAGGRAVVHRLVVAGERAAGRPAPDVVRRGVARVTCTGSTTRCRRRWRRSGSTTRCSRRSACGPLSRRCWPRPEAPTSCSTGWPTRRVRSARLRWPGSTRRSPTSTPTRSSRRSGCACAPISSSTRTTRSSSMHRTTCSCPGRPRRWSCRWPSRLRSPRRSTSRRRVRDWGRCGSLAGSSARHLEVARAVLGDLPGGWVEHDELIVAGQPVDWWLDERREGARLHR